MGDAPFRCRQQPPERLPVVWPTVLHMLAGAAVADPHHEAVVFGEQRLSYGDIVAGAAALAGELRAQGIGGGSRVALLMRNSVDMLIALFGGLAAGAQLVPLNPDYTASELGPILDNAGCCAVIHDAALADGLSALLDGLALPVRIRVGEGRRTLVPADAAVPAGAGIRDWPAPLPAPEDAALLLYTGGTTGRAKGVVLSHRAVAINTSQREALLPTRAGCERFLVMTPLFHAYAIASCLSAVFARGTIVLLPKYRPEAVLQTIEQEGITILVGSPTIFVGLLASPALDAVRMESLTCSYSGSAALPAEILDRWERKSGSVVVEGYGQTEAGPVLTYNPLQGRRKTGSVGLAAPLTDIEIVDLQTGTRVLPQGETGEIRARGPQLMSGYRDLPDETRAALRDGWLYTGDIGQLDEDGYLVIRDRKKDMAIVSGFNVYPREVEEALMRHPLVRECAVVGRPDAYRGETLFALVVPASAELSRAALEQHLERLLVKYKRPAQYRFVAQLPKTTVGKPDKVRIRRELSNPAAVTAASLTATHGECGPR